MIGRKENELYLIKQTIRNKFQTFKFKDTLLEMFAQLVSFIFKGQMT